MARTLGIDAAALLRTARTRSGLSQRALAGRTGTSQSVVARIELGQVSPTVSTLNRLIRAAGHDLEVRVTPAGAEAVASRARVWFESRALRGIVSAYLFGSAARGERHRESDIDVAVLLDRDVYPTPGDRSLVRVRLSSELVAALGVNEVDLMILNDLPPGLARAIVVDGTPLFVGNADQDHAFARTVQLRWADLAPFLRRTSAVKREALRR